jgi:hypothetical protein
MLPSEPDLTPAMIQQRIGAGSRTIMEFREAQLGIIADRRRNPRDDVTDRLTAWRWTNPGASGSPRSRRARLCA